MLSTSRLAGLLLIITMSGSATSLNAAVFTVTKLIDSNDGLCDADCSLREAVVEANATVGNDTISLPAGTLTLSIAGRDENAAATGDLDITEDVEIRGRGAEITLVDGNGLDRIFQVFVATVEIAELTLLDGLAAGEDRGGAIANEGTLMLTDLVVRDNSAAGGGGGIFNSATLLVERSTVSGNRVTGPSGNGGGIENTSDLDVVTSTINGNQTLGVTGNGGGLVNFANADLRNTTVSGNSASGTFGDGGGIHTSSELTLVNSTINDNTAGDDGDAIAGFGLSQTFTNSLISGDCGNNVTVSGGGNLESPGHTCGLGGGGDQSGVSGAALALGSLANNGGPTRTHALLAGSAAIDRALNGPCPAQDQRLRPRPTDGDGNGAAVCDVGAFEFGAEAPEIFADGFESGNTNAWDSAHNRRRKPTIDRRHARSRPSTATNGPARQRAPTCTATSFSPTTSFPSSRFHTSTHPRPKSSGKPSSATASMPARAVQRWPFRTTAMAVSAGCSCRRTPTAANSNRAMPNAGQPSNRWSRSSSTREPRSAVPASIQSMSCATSISGAAPHYCLPDRDRHHRRPSRRPRSRAMPSSSACSRRNASAPTHSRSVSSAAPTPTTRHRVL